MNNNSNDQKPAISLPKGGGAIKGIGETFQPNLFTGTGNFSIPIFTSPGRGGFGPKLTLQYSTGNGNGPFGLGWFLSIPRITRKTEKGLPEYKDSDVFVMSGAEDLVPVLNDNGQQVGIPDQGDYSITRYRPRTEGLFARIEEWSNKNDASDIHWRATTKENVTSIYGKSASARLVHPDDAEKIYEWLLEETFDAKGNHILYEYIQEDPDLKIGGVHEQNRRYTQRYIRRILYGNTPDTLPDEKKAGPVRLNGTNHAGNNATDRKPRHYVFEVLFDYFDLPDELEPAYDWRELDYKVIPNDWPVDALRNDPFSSYRSGFEIRTLRRCKRVLMLQHFNEGELIDAPLVKSTDFTYGEDPYAGFAVLKEATVWGYRKDPQNENWYISRDMPPVTFKYSEFRPERQRYKAVSAEGGDFPPLALNSPDTTLMDILGDGLPDVVQSVGNGFHYWQNQGNAHLGRRHPQHGNLPPVSLGQANVSVGDMGGDGLADLVVEAPPMSGFYESTPDGGWKTFKRFDEMPSFNLADPDTRLVDLTGDGLSDVLVTRDQHFLWFRSKGEAGYEEPRAIPRRRDLDEFPDVYFSDPAGRVRLADMTGDGLNDIVLVHDGRIDYWPNLGYGRFGKRVTMSKTPRIGYGFDPRRFFLADLDGTGCADLVYVDFSEVHFWFNQSGNSWGEKHPIKGTPFVVDTTALQFADFFGTGTACLIWSYDFGSTPGSNYKLLDFCGGQKPHLLVEMSNNMGATTRTEYASSTKFYLEDKKNGTPWVTNLPFPVQVLEKTEVIDHISKTKLATTYKYHHGYYDGREREFRGFGRVDQYDTEEFEAFSKAGLHAAEDAFENGQKAFHVPPVLTKSWFHTGVYFDDNLRSANGKPYDKQDMLAAYREEFYPGDQRAFAMAGNTLIPANTTAPHEAYRALRGALIRSEVYALDDTDKANHPYTVTENRYEIKELQARHTNPHGVFQAVTKETLSYHYERNPEDPRIGQTLNLAYDQYGNIIRSVSMGYPRRRPLTAFKDDDGHPILGPDGKPIAPYPEQQEIKAIYTFTDFINKDNEQSFYYVGVPCQTRVFEVHGLDWDWPPAEELLPAPLLPLGEGAFEGLENPNDYDPYENDPPADLSTPKKRLVDWKRNYFRRDEALEIIDPRGNLDHRLNLGEIRSLALPYESYQVAFNASQLQQIYQGRQSGIDLVNEGGYQDEDGYWWIPSGRQSFNRNKFYAVQEAADPFNNKTETMQDDYALLVNEVRDALPHPMTNITQARNDYRTLQPCEVTDPNRNRTQVAFDALGLVVGTAIMGLDANDNPIAGDDLIDFECDLDDNVRDDHITDPLGSDPHAILKNATTRLVYDLKRYQDNGEPNVVYTLARETHSKSPGGPASKVQHSFVYSDGFGRETQSKVQAEPGPICDINSDVLQENADPRWVGTGTKIYNNKGKPVRQYEPFFSTTPAFGIAQCGVSPTLFYDPLERVICTIHPNHTYEKVVFDPWHTKTWDVNDTIHPDYRYDPTAAEPDMSHYTDFDPANDKDVGHYFKKLPENDYLPTWYNMRTIEENALTLWPDTDDDGNPLPEPTRTRNRHRRASEQRAALLAARHSATPAAAHLDSLGRTFLTIADNGKDSENQDSYIKTHVTLDIEGNDKTITDPRGIQAFKHQFDIAGRKLVVQSVDAGTKHTLPNALNNPIHAWDSEDYHTHFNYDPLQRPTELRVKKGAAGAWALKEVTIYGESNTTTPEATNHRGQVWKAYDGAGLVINEDYDFKGNLKMTTRRLLKDGTAQISWPFDQDGLDENQALNRLEPQSDIYTIRIEFDALNRVIRQEAPDGTLQEPMYNEANLLEKLFVTADGTRREFVKNIDYNEKGQRTQIEYLNDVTTKYTYDPFTFRLTELTSKRKGTHANKNLQDLVYAYDPVGNIANIRDYAHKDIFNHNDRISARSHYQYDPIYRLIQAKGREHENMTACHYQHSEKKHTEFIQLTDQPITNGQALTNYIETYTYDDSGNIEIIHHQNTTLGTTWNRTQTYEVNDATLPVGQQTPKSNRISTSNAGCSGEDAFQFAHDNNGNIQRLVHLPEMLWDFKNQLVDVQLNVASTPNRAHYQYDAAGQRVRKAVVKNNGSITEECIYLGGYEIYRRKDNAGGITFRRDTSHVMDDKNRIALIETEKDANGDSNDTPRGRFQLTNHLGSSLLEVDDSQDADIISYEEYYPYGGSAYMAGRDAAEAKQKRYRYSGKERDDETGMYYYGARYFAPWVGRWVSADAFKDSERHFIFCDNNPIRLVDSDGHAPRTPRAVSAESALPEDLFVTQLQKYYRRLGRLLEAGGKRESVAATEAAQHTYTYAHKIARKYRATDLRSESFTRFRGLRDRLRTKFDLRFRIRGQGQFAVEFTRSYSLSRIKVWQYITQMRSLLLATRGSSRVALFRVTYENIFKFRGSDLKGIKWPRASDIGSWIKNWRLRMKPSASQRGIWYAASPALLGGLARMSATIILWQTLEWGLDIAKAGLRLDPVKRLEYSDVFYMSPKEMESAELELSLRKDPFAPTQEVCVQEKVLETIDQHLFPGAIVSPYDVANFVGKKIDQLSTTEDQISQTGRESYILSAEP